MTVLTTPDTPLLNLFLSRPENTVGTATAGESKTLIINISQSLLSSLRERHRTESSNASSSLNNSSSVEVLSEIDDEQKFENSLSNGFY